MLFVAWYKSDHGECEGRVVNENGVVEKAKVCRRAITASNLMDMRQLVTKDPDVHHEFMNGNHAVSHSSNAFAQVWTDIALEQSINTDYKSKGGIVGISQNQAL